jgi:4-hydroxy 2-oxovalerate aldolase
MLDELEVRMFRPEIKIIDCTIRDGGLMNDSRFPLETVRAIYRMACDAGIDYVELGYRNSKKLLSEDDFGPWRFCDEQDLRKATDGIEPRVTKLAIMMDAHKSSERDLPPKDKSVVDMVRVATYVKDIDKAIHLCNAAQQAGYETTINLMSISKEAGPFLTEALQQIEAETKTQAVYVVDSFGSLYSEEVHYFAEMFQMHLKTKQIGVHMHNNQQLAFANTIEGVIKGANYLDGTLYGLGRGAGNCPTELLLGFLKNPKFNIVPVLQAIQDYILPLQKEIPWGYHVPYMLTGVRNLHPQTAIEWVESDKRNQLVDFYRKLEVEFE